MGAPRFTPAQREALSWLSPDWRTKPGRISSAIRSLRLSHKGLVEEQVGDFGPRGGFCARYRLTTAGVAAKAKMWIT